MKIQRFLFAGAIAILPFEVAAQPSVAQPKPSSMSSGLSAHSASPSVREPVCEMEISFAINYTGYEKSMKESELRLEERSAKIKALAKQAGLGDVEFTSLDYGIDTEDLDWYYYDAAVSLKMPSEQREQVAFLDLLSKERFHSSVNVSEQRVCR